MRLRLVTSNGARVPGVRIPKARAPVITPVAARLMCLAEKRPGSVALIGKIVDDILADIEAKEADDDYAS